MVVRRITEYDGDLVAELFRRSGKTGVRPSARFFGDDRTILLVAFAGAAPAGFLYAYVLPGLATSAPEMFLYSIDVFVEFRRQGVAAGLMMELKRLSSEYGCREMFVMTNAGNAAAMRLYETTGGRRENLDDVLFVYDAETFPDGG